MQIMPRNLPGTSVKEGKCAGDGILARVVIEEAEGCKAQVRSVGTGCDEDKVLRTALEEGKAGNWEGALMQPDNQIF